MNGHTDTPASASLQAAVALAVRVEAVRGPTYDPRRRDRNAVLAVIDHPGDVAELVANLRFTGWDEQVSLMTPGDPTLAFFGRSRDLLAAVSLMGPWLRWVSWPFDMRLMDPEPVFTLLARYKIVGTDGEALPV